MYIYINNIKVSSEHSKVFTVVVKKTYSEGSDLGMTSRNAAVGVPFTVHNEPAPGRERNKENRLLIALGKKMTKINTSRRMNKCMVTDLQVLLQPVVLPEEKLLAKLEVKVDLGGQGYDVDGPYVPAEDTHSHLGH